MDWSGGVDSVKVTTVQSELNPNGLARNELAWLNNGTVRDGGISPRLGWQYLFDLNDGSGIYQGGYLYCPTDDGLPYIVCVISGELFWVDLISGIITNLSDPIFSVHHNISYMLPANIERATFCQAEEFLIIQAGDYTTNPLIWWGSPWNLMHQSLGLNPPVNPGVGGTSQIPPAGPMDYYMGRLWYGRGRQYGAGDLVGGPSGTATFGGLPFDLNFRNSIFEVTENPLCVNGLDFTVPSQAGNIRAIKHSASINTQTGQGLLYIFTRNSVYSMEVPVSRADWIGTGNQQSYDYTTGAAIPTAQGQMATQRVVQMVNGAVNDNSVVSVNGDLYYQSFEPGIRSLVTAVRYFEQPGNRMIDNQVYRLIKWNDRELMRFASGIYFDNRLIQTQLPEQTDQGVISRATAVLDFVPLSTNKGEGQSIWEGMYENVKIMQLFEGDFQGRQRAFAIVRAENGRMQVWELSAGLQDFNEFGDARVTMIIEFPAYNFSDLFKLKKLVSGELWFDRLIGTVDFQMDYRVDGDHCWNLWHIWQECSARDSSEDVPPLIYPRTEYCESYRWTKTLPLPPASCNPQMRRPMNVGYQFQPRLVIKGNCRIRGLLLKAEKVDESVYSNLVC